MDPNFSGTTWSSWPDKGLAFLFLASLGGILAYVRSLIFFDTPPIIFDASHFLAVLALSVILVRSRLSYRFQVFLVLLSTFALLIIVPLRLPPGIVSNGPDMIYQLQIMRGIASSGNISFNAPTTYALGYIFTPLQETLLVMVSMVLGTSMEIVLKYAAPVFGVLTVAFLLGFYRAYFSKEDALIAAFLAGNCFWFLQTPTVHMSLALVFLSLAMYTLTKPSVLWRLLTILSVLAIVSTHEFTAIVGSVFFVFVALAMIILSRWFGFKRGSVENATFRMPAYMATLTFAWLSFVAFPFFGSAVGLVGFVIGALLTGSAHVTVPLASGLPYSWEQIVGDVCVAFFALTCISGSIMILKRRESSGHLQFLPYAVSSAIIFIIGFVSFLRFHAATDLLMRGFIFVYFFAAPVALYAILKISAQLRRPAGLRQALIVLLMLIIVVGGVYTSYTRSAIDNSAPLNVEDVRFPLYQWQAAGYFVLGHGGGNVLWGDKIAFDFVGGYGERDVNVFDSTLNLTLSEWMSTVPSSGDVVILRQSMPIIPYASYQVTSQGLHEILVGHDFVYSSGEVVMIVA